MHRRSPLLWGAELHLVPSSAESVELHLHGYDILRDAGRDAPAVLKFTADHMGRFAIGARGHDVLLGRKEKAFAYLEVRAE